MAVYFKTNYNRFTSYSQEIIMPKLDLYKKINNHYLDAIRVNYYDININKYIYLYYNNRSRYVKDKYILYNYLKYYKKRRYYDINIIKYIILYFREHRDKMDKFDTIPNWGNPVYTIPRFGDCITQIRLPI